MGEETYKVGEVVRVFEDPITKSNLEGRAVVVGVLGQNMYEVYFLRESESMRIRKVW